MNAKDTLKDLASGKEVSQKRAADAVNALLSSNKASASRTAKVKGRLVVTGHRLGQTVARSTVCGGSALAAGRYQDTKALKPAVRGGVGLVLTLGALGASLLYDGQAAAYLGAVGEGLLDSGIAQMGWEAGAEMKKKADAAAPATTPPAAAAPADGKTPGVLPNQAQAQGPRPMPHVQRMPPMQPQEREERPRVVVAPNRNRRPLA